MLTRPARVDRNPTNDFCYRSVLSRFSSRLFVAEVFSEKECKQNQLNENPAALRASRSAQGEMISFGVNSGPVFRLGLPSCRGPVPPSPQGTSVTDCVSVVTWFVDEA